jgi:hypothetical protein
MDKEYRMKSIHLLSSGRPSGQIGTGAAIIVDMVPNVVESADVRMVQRGGGFGLALKTGKHLGVFGYIIGKKLQGDKAIEFDVLGLVDDTHATAAESLDDAVMRDRLPCKGTRVRHVGGF